MIASRQWQLNREFAEQVLLRAEFLDQPDRALLEQVLGQGVQPRQIAAVTGRSCRSVQRQIQKLMARLTDPAVVHILRNHRRWDRTTGQVALSIFVRKQTLRRTAENLDLSLHRVRQYVQTVRGLLEAARLQHDPGREARCRS